MLVNLLANAARHGRPPIEITLASSTITVQDHGAGFPDDILQAGPQRFARRGASGGAGLGLAIAVQHATAMGLQLTLRNAERGGAVVEIGLAAEQGA
ncbi:hypothetical protein AX769_17800 [Frondihabitans sp. PAMC 28766]|uniref:ATP-binding protein n=1 Tax=Frondihabitans sp. PAMC 28766 TaxID=1795630 RepID=UPI00078C51E5|nr:ATP-binding protein [Frondihabitans sp. PAMC 28766]AMM21660.1 hypothetical protein AX769_17800 [Frondihabitans sp. PAMC 28766]